MQRSLKILSFLLIVFFAFASPIQADCTDLPDHSALTAVLERVVNSGGNAGLSNEMWATLVDRDGIVCAVTFTGDERGDQWPGSRVISAQKANTANAFSLPNLSLSTANLYSAVQPGGSLFGLQESNPVDTSVAYGGDSADYGTSTDPMVGKKIGGVNVFGGGLALYDASGELLGAVGVSGDTSCTDHITAWKVRDSLDLDSVPAGVADGTDNMILDIKGSHGNFQSKSGFGHPECGFGESGIIKNLPGSNPIE